MPACQETSCKPWTTFPRISSRMVKMKGEDLSAPMQRMMRNAVACGDRGLWVHGRSEISTAMALQRRGLVKVCRKQGRLGDFVPVPMPVIVRALKHIESCNCHSCRTIRWRNRMNLQDTEVVGFDCLTPDKKPASITRDLGFSENGFRVVEVKKEKTPRSLHVFGICILYPPYF